MAETTAQIEDETSALENFLRSTVEDSPISYIQVLRPIMLYPTYVAISQTAFGVKSLSLLDALLSNNEYRFHILNSLHLGQPSRIIVRPSVHGKEEADIELRYPLKKLEFYPSRDYHKYLLERKELPEDERIIMKITAKTATREDITGTIDALLTDMLKHEKENNEHWHGLLVVYLSGYRFKPNKRIMDIKIDYEAEKKVREESLQKKKKVIKPPETVDIPIDLTSQRLFLTFFLIPHSLIEEFKFKMPLQIRDKKYTLRTKKELIQVTKFMVETAIETKRKAENFDRLDIIDPQIGYLESKLDLLLPLFQDVTKLKTDVSELKTDVSELKTDVSELKTKTDKVINLLEKIDKKSK